MNPLRLPTPRTSLLPRAGRTGPGGPATPEEKDAIVQQTDVDASQSRLSAIETGAGRKFPIINRGTFIRTTALDRVVNTFLSSSPGSRKQIISFGAGSDTRFFRLRQTLPTEILSNLVYHEIDFPAVTTPKVKAILKHQLLPQESIVVADEAKGSFESAGYYVHPRDLRTLSPGCEMPKGVETTVPTLFLSECCLIYLSPEEADGILKWATGDFKGDVGVVVYEPIGGDDAFGKVMIQNLAARGIVLKTLKKYSSLERQKMRFKMLGFTTGQDAADVYFVSENWISEEEKERINRLEMLDEVEEWRMLARHYCFAWGWRGDIFEAWREGWPLQR
ncbi:S-adenosyl-L-methionine-dependent methyltransferase [Pyronema omphalodes]|nr:S-adenosyl-L-methionine-dependent methyltransferase [Pyronema omphalodes]